MNILPDDPDFWAAVASHVDDKLREERANDPLYVTVMEGGNWYRCPTLDDAMRGLNAGEFVCIAFPVYDRVLVYDTTLAREGYFPFREIVALPVDAEMLSFKTDA